MLITFQSRAAADVIMFGDNAKEMLRILGKDPESRQGIFTVEQLPAAIITLRSAIAENKAHHSGSADTEEDADRTGMGAPVSLAQRAYPLLEMMEYAQKEQQPVTWGT